MKCASRMRERRLIDLNTALNERLIMNVFPRICQIHARGGGGGGGGAVAGEEGMMILLH